MWRVLSESAVGTSHQANGTVCQDSYFVSPVQTNGEIYLLLACSDGAGSAKASEIGSKLICEQLVGEASKFLAGNALSEINRDVLLEWVRNARAALVVKAAEDKLELRDLACTVLFAALGPAAAVFLQIGDGAIVVSSDTGYRPIFWPQTGEYHNTTYFITDQGFEQNILTEIVSVSPSEIALFTDGLELLALHYATRTAHSPFFEPMFKVMRGTEDTSELAIPLRQFLDSAAVNTRTDDDKTLILAVRIIPSVSDPA